MGEPSRKIQKTAHDQTRHPILVYLGGNGRWGSRIADVAGSVGKLCVDSKYSLLDDEDGESNLRFVREGDIDMIEFTICQESDLDSFCRIAEAAQNNSSCKKVRVIVFPCPNSVDCMGLDVWKKATTKITIVCGWEISDEERVCVEEICSAMRGFSCVLEIRRAQNQSYEDCMQCLSLALQHNPSITHVRLDNDVDFFRNFTVAGQYTAANGQYTAAWWGEQIRCCNIECFELIGLFTVRRTPTGTNLEFVVSSSYDMLHNIWADVGLPELLMHVEGLTDIHIKEEEGYGQGSWYIEAVCHNALVSILDRRACSLVSLSIVFGLDDRRLGAEKAASLFQAIKGNQSLRECHLDFMIDQAESIKDKILEALKVNQTLEVVELDFGCEDEDHEELMVEVTSLCNRNRGNHAAASVLTALDTEALPASILPHVLKRVANHLCTETKQDAVDVRRLQKQSFALSFGW